MCWNSYRARWRWYFRVRSMIGGDGMFTVTTSGTVLVSMFACIFVRICKWLYFHSIIDFFPCSFVFSFVYSCIFFSLVIVFHHLYVFVFAFLSNLQMSFVSTGDCTDQQWRYVWLQLTNSPICQVFVIIGFWKCVGNKQHWHFWCVF